MYVRVGTVDGDLEALASRAEALPLQWSPSGYGTTTEHRQLLRAEFPELTQQVDGDWEYAMVVMIEPSGGAIRMHTDKPYEDGLLRHHIVLRSNPDCYSYHDGGFQHLEAGGIYTIDESKRHASVNWGETPRTHLVLDVRRG